MDFRTVNRKIGHVRRSMGTDQAELSLYRSELKSLEYALTPIDGWPGSNAERREAAKVAALEADEDYQKTVKKIAELEYNILLAQAEVSALEDERRGMEWSVRQGYLLHLTGDAKYADEVLEEGMDPVRQLVNEMDRGQITQEEAYAALGIDPNGPEFDEGELLDLPF